MSSPHTDKVVLISGASGGFGSALARAYAADGAKLVLTEREGADVQALRDELGAAAQWVFGDIADAATSRAWVDAAIAAHGRIDIAINNAGIATPFTPIVDTSVELAERVIGVDLMGVFHAMHAELRAMRAQSPAGGAIVNIASVAGLVGAPGLGIYAAAKHAVVGLTKSAAIEHAREGIRVNAVCPSFARTEMVHSALGSDTDEAHVRLTRGVPMRRLAEVDEVVAVVRFAGDPGNGFMTGESLAVDGGIGAC